MTTTITRAQCRAARGLLALTQAEFAAVAKVNLETLRDFEAGRDQHTPSQIEAIRAAIESVGLEFTGDGVRWALPLAPDERSYPIEASRLSGRLGGNGGAMDNPEHAAANRARIDGRSAPEPDPLSPDFISAARRKTERR
jgi:transcriptional regulator with XRE-family HTH domain